LLGDIEPALASEVEVDQRHVWMQFFEAPECISSRRRDSDDREALALEQSACGGDEMGAVIND
jgi:hypothetical protein